MDQVIERLSRVVQFEVRAAEDRLCGMVQKEVGIMQNRVDILQAYLTERIDGLGGLEADSVKTQLAEMRVDLDNLKGKSTTVAPTLATDVYIHLFSAPS